VERGGWTPHPPLYPATLPETTHRPAAGFILSSRWASRKVVESLYTKGVSAVSVRNCSRATEAPVSTQPLTPEQETLAQDLTRELLHAAEADLLAMIRTLLGKGDRDLFGQAEFDVRDLAHHVAAKAYAAVLAQKKTATTAPASPAPAAAAPPAT